MDYVVPSSIKDKKPMDNMQLRAYMNYIKESNKPKDFYAEYSVEYLKDAKVNCYIENKVNLLTIEYDIPNESEEEKKTEKMIIAKNPKKMGNFSEIQEILKSYFRAVSNYATINAIKPKNYIAALKKLGWSFTNEGLDMIQLTKLDGVKSIRKSEFGENEFEELTREDIEQSKKTHLAYKEQELIQTLEDYIIRSYAKIPEDAPEDLKGYKEKVERYSESKNAEENKSKDLLSCMFEEMKPIEEPTSMNGLMQEVFNSNMQAYIDLIPERLRENKTHVFLKKYMQIREAAIGEREEGVLPERSKSMYELGCLVKTMDKHEEKEAEQRREELLNRADKILGIEEVR